MTDSSTTFHFDWSAFWHQPEQLTSFTQGKLAVSYDVGELAHLFDCLVGHLRGDDRILEIACGNGAAAAALLAAVGRLNRPVTIDAIDDAVICPSQQLAARVTFSRARAEELPFSAAIFDLVVSFFGIEFCETAEALRKILRVLKTGGQAASLIYAAESPTVRRLSVYLDVYDNGLQQLIEMIRNSASAGKSTSDAADQNDSVEILRSFIEDRVAQTSFRQRLNEIISDLIGIGNRLDAERNNGFVHEGWSSTIQLIEQEFALMRAIHTAAITSTEARQLVRVKEAMGFVDCCVVPFEFQGSLLGWLLTGEKPGSGRERYL